MSFLKEFKEFAMKGNVLDLAIGFIMGAAFGKIVSSLVEGIIMPLLGLLLGGINIAAKTLTVKDAVIHWGLFLQNVIDFTIIAFSIFLFVKLINMLKLQEAAAPSPPSNEVLLLTEIRDLLKQDLEK